MERNEPKFARIGGTLCLDFTNTVSNHRGREPRENLRTFQDLVSWCLGAGILDEAASQEILRQGTMVPAQGERLLHLAVDFREALYRTFCDINQGRRPSKCDLEVVNALLARTPITLQIGAQGERLVCVRTGCMLDEARLLGPVAWSAAELLGSKESLSKVRECAGEDLKVVEEILVKSAPRQLCLVERGIFWLREVTDG